MNKAQKLALSAIFSLAAALTFSCSSDDGEDNNNPGGVSSSSDVAGGGSSSSVVTAGSSSSVISFTDKGNNISNYAIKVIGTQTWMAENLNYAVEGSKCYDNSQANCDKYGRLYDWATALGLPTSCNTSVCADQIQTKHRGICPSGWHIPSGTEWQTLMNFVDGTSLTTPAGSSTAGRHLKAKNGWKSYNGQDTYEFAALPGGYADYDWDGYSDMVGDYGFWWTATENNAKFAYILHMDYDNYGVHWSGNYKKSILYSIRCVKD